MIIVDTTDMKKDTETVPVAEYNLLSDKYSRLQDQFSEVLKHNQELEDKLLSFVDKSEFDKMRLSHEIDDLSEKLQLAHYAISGLQSDCARYKADCVLAVHLLQCQPSQYVSQKLRPAAQTVAHSLVNGHSAPAETPHPKRTVHVSSFPPMAIVFDNDVANSDSTTTPLANGSIEGIDNEQNIADSQAKTDCLRDLFIEKMAKEPLYNGTVQIHQCVNCGKSVHVEDKQTQTSLAGDLIWFHEESDQLATQPCVHEMKHIDRPKGKRCDSTDSTDTEYGP